MNFEAVEVLPEEETLIRISKCRAHLRELAPEASGLLIFSRLNLYYFTGSFAQGLLWVPVEQEPVLMVRRGVERCRLESSLKNIFSFKSYSEIPGICAEAGSKIGGIVAAEMGGLSWSLSNLLKSRLKDISFAPGDMAVTLTRAVKTGYELAKMHLAGQRQNQFYNELPALIRPGMTEREIVNISINLLRKLGHCGVARLSGLGDELVLGQAAAGNNANYPSHYDGPLGTVGEHPSVPFMGNGGSVWKKNEILVLDLAFTLEGYNTDKTRLYWSGKKSSLPDNLKRAHETCQRIQETAVAQLRPGAIPSAIYEKALSMAEEAGYRENFMGYGKNQVQFLGHGVGLAVDEHPVLARRFNEPLEAGMTMALEPKVCLPGAGMLGVEDTYELTAEGARSITGEQNDIIFME